MAVSKKRKKSSDKKKIIPVNKKIIATENIKNMPTENKLSKVIMDFVRPLSKRMTEIEMTKRMIEFGIFVWNISLLPKEDREKQKDSVLKSFNTNDQQIVNDYNEIFDFLISRKDTFFRHDNRFIVNYEINQHEDKLDLTVGSTSLNTSINSDAR